MPTMSHSLTKNLVLIGGGHSHAIVLKQFGINPLPGVNITLITNVSHTPYSGMLPGYIAGFYDYHDCHIDLRALARFAHCQILIDHAIALNLSKNQVICQENKPINFDVVSIDIGSTPNTLLVPGAKDYAIPAKPVPQFFNHWQELLTERKNKPDQLLRLAIVGGGAGGVELALNMQSSLLREEARGKKQEGRSKREEGKKEEGKNREFLEIDLIQSGRELLPNHNRLVRRRLQEILMSRGIQLYLGETVSKIEPLLRHDRVFFSYLLHCESGLTKEYDRVFWVTQASAAHWLKESGISTDNNGFILVNDYLQSLSHPQIFAAGDIATMINHPRPKAGVFAVRQGKPLYHNLCRFIQDKPLKPFYPQQQYLSLIGTGDKSAIASRGIFMWESPLLWQWKDRIDRQFMQQFP
jgi:pyridine nucleotide-disulfide oxidoreductase family protein